MTKIAIVLKQPKMKDRLCFSLSLDIKENSMIFSSYVHSFTLGQTIKDNMKGYKNV